MKDVGRGYLGVVGVRDGAQVQLRDPVEVCGIAAIQRQPVSDGEAAIRAS